MLFTDGGELTRLMEKLGQQCPLVLELFASQRDRTDMITTNPDEGLDNEFEVSMCALTGLSKCSVIGHLQPSSKPAQSTTDARSRRSMTVCQPRFDFMNRSLAVTIATEVLATETLHR